MTIRELPPQLAAIAKAELNEDPKRLEQDIQDIKDWISKQPHLKARTDDQWLVAILRGCKFSLERVKKKLDLYYTLRNTAADITRRFSPLEDKFFEILRLGVCLILPKSRDPLSPRVVLLRPGAYDINKYNIADVLCVFYYVMQILVNEDDTSTVVGTKTLVDYNGITIGHVSQSTPALIKKMIVVMQDSMPLRLKGNHHFNLHPIVESGLNVVRSLVNEKAKQRMMIHKDVSELQSHFPNETIPAEYGGSAGTIDEIAESWVQKCKSYSSWMQQELQFGTDESRRVGRPVTAEDMFGIEGSFRKLDFD